MDEAPHANTQKNNIEITMCSHRRHFWGLYLRSYSESEHLLSPNTALTPNINACFIRSAVTSSEFVRRPKIRDRQILINRPRFGSWCIINTTSAIHTIHTPLREYSGEAITHRFGGQVRCNCCFFIDLFRFIAKKLFSHVHDCVAAKLIAGWMQTNQQSTFAKIYGKAAVSYWMSPHKHLRKREGGLLGFEDHHVKRSCRGGWCVWGNILVRQVASWDTHSGLCVNENLQLDELEWRFKTKGRPGNYVQSIVTAMYKFPPLLTLMVWENCDAITCNAT